MALSEYNADDIERLSDIEHVRRRPGMHFGADGITCIQDFVARLADDPKLLGAETVETESWNGWRIVRSNLDWLPDDSESRSSIFESFSPFCMNGINSFHYTVFVTALAEKAVTMGSGFRHVICGDVLDNDPIWTYCENMIQKRALAFVIDESIFD